MSGKRPLRILIGKPGLDGHDKGGKVVALALRDAGNEVIYTGLHRTVEQIVETALHEDVDIIGLSILSGAHMPVTQKLMRQLHEKEMDDVHVLIGGNIPFQDRDRLIDLGVEAVFPTSSRLEDIVAYVNGLEPLERR